MALDQTPTNGTSAPDAADLDYWHAYVDERAAAEFVGLDERSLQRMRQRGGGPKYSRFSSRCIRYTRAWLRDWAVARIRTSTSDQGEDA